MSDDDKDVFGKVDALMRRHNIAGPMDGSDTGGVPLLTDLVEVPGESRPAAAHPPDDLAGRVLADVQSRLAHELERRLADRIGPQLHDAVQAAVHEMRGELARMVAEAVAQAIERRHVK